MYKYNTFFNLVLEFYCVDIHSYVCLGGAQGKKPESKYQIK